MGAPELIPLFGLGVQEKSRPANAQRRINLYYEMQQDQDRTKMVAFGTPGLELFTEFTGGKPSRGAIAPRNSPYAFLVNDLNFWRIDSAGAQTNLGTLGSSTGKVSMTDNGRYVVIVDGVGGYYYDMQGYGALTQITNPLFPNGARTITWLDSYFIAELDGAFHISDPNNPPSWPGDSAAAESSPDDLLRCLGDHQELTLFGGDSIEFWANTGDADFPFARIPGAATEWGLAARDSVAPLDDSLAFLAQNRLGQVIAARLDGYRVTRLSNHDLEAKWAAFASRSDAVGYSYMLDGHPMYVINFPTGGQTWMFDSSTNGWFQLMSHGLTRHRSDLHFPFAGGNYVTDFDNGKVYRLRSDVYTDAGDPIRRLISGRHVHDGLGRLGIDAFQVDIESGVGLDSGQGANPQAMLRVSRDGGRSWGPERWAPFGAVGQYTKRCLWRRCGRARDFVFEIAISDPVKVAILGAGIKPRAGSS